MSTPSEAQSTVPSDLDAAIAQQAAEIAEQMLAGERDFAPIPLDNRIFTMTGNAASDAVAETPVPIITLDKSLANIKRAAYKRLVNVCKEIVAREGLISNFIDLMKELNSQGMEVKVKGSDDTFMPLFQHSLNQVNAGIVGKERGIDAVLRKFVDAEWVTGMSVWLIRSETRPVPGMKNKSFVVPAEITLLDPTAVNLDKIYTTGEIEMDVSDDFVKAIVAQGNKHWFVSLFPKGTKAKTDPPNANKQNDILALAKKGTKSLPLPVNATKILRRIDNDSDIYPIPYLIRVVEALNDKRMLRNMNRSMLTKVINLILHVKVASGIPNKPVKPEVLQQTRAGMEQQVQNDPSRFQVAVTGDTVTYQWVTVPTDSMFSRDHYTVANFEVFAALLGVIANQLLATTGSIDQTMVIKTLYGKNEQTIQRFKRFIEDVFDITVINTNPQVLKKVGPGNVTIRPKRISIWETDAFKTMITAGVKMGCLPARTFVEEVNEDWESVVRQLEQEEELRQSKEILFGFPAYRQVSGPAGGSPNDGTTKQDTSTPSKGKPEGQPQEDTVKKADK